MDPTKYSKSYDFSGYQTANPTSPLPAPQVDNELANIQTAVGQVVDAVKEVRRSDGALKNQIVTPDSLSAATRSLLVGDFNPRGDWATATGYAAKDIVSFEGATYVATTAHTSAAFATDLAAGRWMLVASPYSLTGAVFSQVFSGDGSTTTFTLSQPFTDIEELGVYVQDGSGGYHRLRTSGASPQASLTGPTQLTISPAPGSGTRNVFVEAINQTAVSSAAAASAAQAAAEVAQAAAEAAEAAADASATSAASDAGAASASATLAASYYGDGKGGTFTAVGGETTLTLRDANGVEFSAPTGLEWTLELSRGGVMQRPGVDYTTNGTSTLALTTAADAGEEFWWVRKGGVAAVSSTLAQWADLTPPSGAVVGTTDTQTLSNKTLTATTNVINIQDDKFAIYDNGLTSRKAVFQCGGISDATTRTYTFPDMSGTFALTAGAQTFTSKTIVVASNTITTAASGNLAATELNAALAELQGDIDTRATSSALTTHTGATSGAHGISAFGATLVDDADAAASRTTLGLVIGTDVQAYSATLASWAGKTVPTGAVVGTSDTQTLTNKTLTSPALTDSIAFPATQVASSDANTLDDYEEGTFTPTIVGRTSAGTGTYVTQVGRYTKIGNRVFYFINVRISAHTGTGNMRISGLPFVCAISNNTGVIATDNLVYASGSPVFYSTAGQSYFDLYTQSGAGTNAAIAMDTSCEFMLSGHYSV